MEGLLEKLCEALLLGSEDVVDNRLGFRIARRYAAKTRRLRFLCGIAYLRGIGVEQDLQQGISLIGEAANCGDAGALSVMGYLYDYGLHVAKDRQLSVSYYRKAALGGEVNAMLNVARCYRDGVGVVRSAVMSAKWEQRAMVCKKVEPRHNEVANNFEGV